MLNSLLPTLRRPVAAAVLALLAGGAAHAQQAQSMEERLRAQLRITTAQLQQAQTELATYKAGPAAPVAAAKAPAGEVDTLKKDLARSQSQLAAAERQSREKLATGQQQAQAALEKADAQIAQYRNAYDELLKLARSADAERQRLGAEAAAQRTAIAQCEVKNGQLYTVGLEILRAYETVDVGTVMSARQPFAAQTRVKFEEIAQQYGDKLYEGRFDARSAAAPAPAPAATPAATPAQ